MKEVAIEVNSYVIVAIIQLHIPVRLAWMTLRIFYPNSALGIDPTLYIVSWPVPWKLLFDFLLTSYHSDSWFKRVRAAEGQSSPLHLVDHLVREFLGQLRPSFTTGLVRRIVALLQTRLPDLGRATQSHRSCQQLAAPGPGSHAVGRTDT